MSTHPCQICGSTDLNLVDGFYYCVECGTQDATVRETVLERVQLADGTFLVSSKKKISKIKESIEMSGEWHKWHAFNFILAGLTEELLKLGAKPSVKKMILWIWIRYIKKFQEKEHVDTTQFEDNNQASDDCDMSQELNNNNSNIDDTGKISDDDDDDDYNEISQCTRKKRSQKTNKKPDKFKLDVKIVTNSVFISIIYAALNLDRSEIQLTDLLRFIREGKLSLYNSTKFVPKEISLKLIPKWVNFSHAHKEFTAHKVRTMAMTLFKRLDLGTPLVPDINKIIHNYVQEFCLPEDFENLVLSLINHSPCNFLEMDSVSMTRSVRLPHYEEVCMAYVLVAMKICFGLDCEYEEKLSDAVEKINAEENHPQSYKHGLNAQQTDRLFSFREWYMFIQFRKMILCKYYLPMARLYNLPVDDCVFMEHLQERNKRKIRLTDDVTMNILNTIPLEDIGVIPKTEFPGTLTPMTAYTEVISQYLQDPDVKLRLCEDFAQYSLKYATKTLKLPGYDASDENFIKGVSKRNKVINPYIMGNLTWTEPDLEMILIRNCENKNWRMTKPPKLKHVTKIKNKKNTGENENDCAYDSSTELAPVDNDDSKTESSDVTSQKNTDEDSNCDVIQEENENLSIFDDNFADLEDDKNTVSHIEESATFATDTFEVQNEDRDNILDSNVEVHESRSETSEDTEIPFNPETFDRQKTIQELIEKACKKYKIPIPKEKEPRAPMKRKNLENNEGGGSSPKKNKSNHKRMGKGESLKFTQKLIDAYYENVNNDVLQKISEHVKLVIQMANKQVERNNPNPDEAFDNQNEVDSHNITDIDEGHLSILENNRNSVANDSSVQCVTLNGTVDDEADIEELLPKTNPQFDPKTHDIKQLYINIKEESKDFSDFTHIESDPEIDKIINEKILEFERGDGQTAKHTENIEVSRDTDNFEDVLSENLSDQGKKGKRAKLKRLLKNKHVKDFHYWIRHYRSRPFTRRLDIHESFKIELKENCPISFNFVICECASMLNCSPFLLYKAMQSLEESLFS